jgi:hypothetical protein
MIFRLTADFLLLVHFLFVIFTLLGGLLLVRYPNLWWMHLSALSWGILVQLANWICPLTYVENYFRLQAGEQGYTAGFLEHFILKILYPENLTLELRYLLGISLILTNVAIYSYLILNKRSKLRGT